MEVGTSSSTKIVSSTFAYLTADFIAFAYTLVSHVPLKWGDWRRTYFLLLFRIQLQNMWMFHLEDLTQRLNTNWLCNVESWSFLWNNKRSFLHTVRKKQVIPPFDITRRLNVNICIVYNLNLDSMVNKSQIDSNYSEKIRLLTGLTVDTHVFLS